MNVSVVTFRAHVPAATLAQAPAVIKLAPISPAMVELQMWCDAVPVLATSGFRLFTRDGQIVPGNGSDETGIVFAEYEADWAPLPNTRLTLPLADKLLPGPAFDLTLHIYSSGVAGGLNVGGFLVTRDPQFGVHDLVTNLSGWMEKLNTRDK